MSRSARRLGKARLGCAVLILGSAIGWAAPPASATTFQNLSTITINPGQATPYPSVIGVPAGGVIADVNVTLWEMNAFVSDNIDILLVAPSGKSVVLMADVDGLPATPPQAIDLTLDDSAATAMPPNGTGSYRPTNLGAFSDTSISGPYGSHLSEFNGSPQGGSWKLYVWNDGNNITNFGRINGGWSLDITSLQITAFAPTSGPPGTSVAIAGSGFTGATAVRFGAAASTSFTVAADSAISATVPAGATTGPISVVTPDGTASSDTDFTVTTQGITSITPTSGEVGTPVAIAGKGFAGATAVKFGTTAATFSVGSDTQITATVPAGASTGAVSVLTPSGTLVSPMRFVVQHPRSISIHRTRAAVRGRLTVGDAFDVCRASVPVNVQHRVGARWITVARVRTGAGGSFRAAGLEDPGAYRALAKKTRLRSGDLCLKALSPTAR